ncbi:MAG: hypothetical protein AABZ07_02270, partial [Nitrospirota bacterium]
ICRLCSNYGRSFYCLFSGFYYDVKCPSSDENPPPLNPLPQGEGKYEGTSASAPPLTGAADACTELVEGGDGKQRAFSDEPSCPFGAQRGMKINGTRMSRLSTIDGVFQPRLSGIFG